jgi:SAM-dependent methyltransferase
MLSSALQHHCPLCKTPSSLFYENKRSLYWLCPTCSAIFLDQKYLPSPEEEAERYQTHNNDVNDAGYQKFVSPIVNQILENFSPQSVGLDFGAGTGPVISKMLLDKGFQVAQYDPFFHNFPELLNNKYNYIACCEVIEHFHNPAKEFQMLKRMLLPDGKLYCMTSIYNPEIDFSKWYYKNDPTHVFIYQAETLKYIAKQFSYSNVEIFGNLVVFSV